MKWDSQVKLFQPVVHCGLKQGGFTNFWASVAQTLIFGSSKKECQRQSILRIEVFLQTTKLDLSHTLGPSQLDVVVMVVVEVCEFENFVCVDFPIPIPLWVFQCVTS